MPTQTTKKVLIVGRFMFPYGNATTKHAVELALSLFELGFEPYLVSLLADGPAQFESMAQINGVKLLSVGENGPTETGKDVGFKMRGPYKNESSTAAALARHIRNKGGDYALVLSLTIGLAPLNTIGRAVRRARLPWCHLLVEEVASLELGQDKAFWARPLVAIRGMLTAMALYGACLRRANVICCITPDLRELLLRIGYSKQRVHFMPNIKSRRSADFLPPPDSRSIGDPDYKCPPFPYLFFSGNLSFTKEEFGNLSVAIAALKARGKSVGVVFVGTGEERQVARLMRLACELNIQELMCWKGFVPDDVLNSLRKQALAHVMLKRNIRFNRFNFSTRLLEYLATGRPILLSNLKVHLAYFTHGDNALIVDPNDSDQIIHAIEWVCDKPKEAELIGRAGRELLKREFDGALNVNSLLERLGISCSG